MDPNNALGKDFAAHEDLHAVLRELECVGKHVEEHLGEALPVGHEELV